MIKRFVVVACLSLLFWTKTSSFFFSRYSVNIYLLISFRFTYFYREQLKRLKNKNERKNKKLKLTRLTLGLENNIMWLWHGKCYHSHSSRFNRLTNGELIVISALFHILLTNNRLQRVSRNSFVNEFRQSHIQHSIVWKLNSCERETKRKNDW